MTETKAQVDVFYTIIEKKTQLFIFSAFPPYENMGLVLSEDKAHQYKHRDVAERIAGEINEKHGTAEDPAPYTVEAWNRITAVPAKKKPKIDIQKKLENMLREFLGEEWEYFVNPDNYYDKEHIINGRGEYLGVNLQLAGGGPTIWANFSEQRINGSWMPYSATFEIPRLTCEKVNAYFEQEAEELTIRGGDPR